MWVPAAAACHLTYDLEHGLPVADAPAAVSAAVSPLSVDKGEEEEFLLHTNLDRSRFTGHDIFPTEKRTGHFFVEIKRKNVIGTRCSCWSTIPRQNDSLIPTVALSRHARHSVHFVHFKEKENEMDRPSLRQPIDRSTVDLTLVKRLLTMDALKFLVQTRPTTSGEPYRHTLCNTWNRPASTQTRLMIYGRQKKRLTTQ